MMNKRQKTSHHRIGSSGGKPFLSMGYIKGEFFLVVRNNVLLAVVVPTDKVHLAECLEQSVILMGIFLMVPLNAPEQSKAIQKVIYTRSILDWKILLLRFAMSTLLLIMMICLFSEIMIWKNCTFLFMACVM